MRRLFFLTASTEDYRPATMGGAAGGSGPVIGSGLETEAIIYGSQGRRPVVPSVRLWLSVGR